MKEEFAKVKLGDMYVKDFKIIVIKDGDDYWRVRKEISLINSKEDGIPIIKEEAQGIMKLLDKNAILVDLERVNEE